MMNLGSLFARLARDCSGSMLIETAFVAPVLAVLSIGGFEVSGMVARQNELESAMAEAAQIALAAKPDTQAKINKIQDVVKASTGLPTNKVLMSTVYRCQGGTTYVNTTTSCTAGTTSWQYLKIELKDTYTPQWTQFGVGSGFNYDLVRYVLVAG